MVKQIRLFKDFYHPDIELLFVEASAHCYPVHFHKRFCLGEILSGVMAIEYEYETRYYKKGDIFVIPPRKIHSCKINRGESAYYHVLSFGNVETLIRRISENHLLSGILSDRYVSNITRMLENQKFAACRYNAVVDAIAGYLDQKYLEPVKVESLAAAFGLSSSRMQHIFKEKTGISISKYILLERLRKSKEILLTESLTDVALECGFYDQSHFYRYFKQYTGITPQNYAKVVSNLPGAAESVANKINSPLLMNGQSGFF